MVFAIDYRLACSFDDPNLIGPPPSPILPLCGWPYSVTDPFPHIDSSATGAAIHDVEDAVAWVKVHGGDSCSCFNGKIELVGSSWGGNLTFMASRRLGAGHTDQVQALAAWSRALELQRQTNTYWPCDSTQSSDGADCGHSTNIYLGCVPQTYPDPACESPPPYGRYSDASPINFFGISSPTGWPRVYFANGGGGSSSPELQSLQAAKDFAAWLNSVRWVSGTNYEFCTVDKPLHAQQYLNNSSCEGETVTVLQSMISFLQSAVA